MVKYNYDFLRKWIENSHVSYREVMRAVGNSSANNLHDWLGDGPAQERQREKGEDVKPVPMKVDNIVRFCNHFNVPISSFFIEDFVKMTTKGGVQNNNEDISSELAHLREITRMKDEARKREDAIRKECEDRVRQREKELQDIIRMKDEEITRLKGNS